MHARTGVHRVVEELADYLVDHDSVDLRWAIHGNPTALWDFVELAQAGKLAGCPLQSKLTLRRLIDTCSVPVDFLGNRKWASFARRLTPLIESAQKAVTFSAASASAVDIFHSPFHRLPDLRKAAPHTVRFQTIYDLIPIKFPEFFETRATENLKATIGELEPDDWVLCISECTRRDLLEYRSDLKEGNVRVVPLAASEHFYPCHESNRTLEVRQKYGIKPNARYFLSVATLEPRKNLEHLIRVFASLDDELDEDVHLVLAGTQGWKTSGLLDSLSAKVHSRVNAIGFVDDADLAPLYSDALAFVYPSLYEGFGLPPLEAMQCGVPVITSDNSSIPEVVGSAAILVSATAEEELADALSRVATDEEMRAKMAREGLVHAKEFSWERFGDLTVAAYRNAIASH